MNKNKPSLYEQLNNEGHVDVSTYWSWRNNVFVKYIIYAITVITCGAFFPGTVGYIFSPSKTFFSLKGTLWQNETIRAEYPFPIVKSKSDYQNEIDSARNTCPMVFTSNQNTIRQISKDIFHQKVQQILPNGNGIENIVSSCDSLYTFYLSKYILVTNNNVITQPRVLLEVTNVNVNEIDTSECLDSKSLHTHIEKIIAKYSDIPKQRLSQLSDSILILFPNIYTYSLEKTQAEIDARIDDVAQTSGIVRNGEIVVANNELITDEVLQRIRSYGMMGSEAATSMWSYTTFLGALGHSAIVCSLMFLFIRILRKRIHNDNLWMSAFGAILIFVALMSWITTRIETSIPIEFIILIPVFSLLITILIDSRTAFTLTITCSLLVAGVRANDYTTALAMMIAGTFGAYSVRDLQNRNQLFRSMGFIGIGFTSTIIFLGLEKLTSPTSWIMPLLAGWSNSILSPILTFGLLALYDRYSTDTTDLVLEKYDNLSHPLLLEMSDKAPGTYQHTLAVANLVEAAATSIGANPLLAKVGAYFHDIGKIQRAEYYIENQINIENKHNYLAPKKSASIIRQHIEDGITLANEYNLPVKVIDFIPMHHGTTLMMHFFAMAVTEARAAGTQDVDETDFRYPGPKPNTKETAILMLADSVEAVSRTIAETEQLEERIHEIIFQKITDNQLDESPLTFAEIRIIEEVFVKNLTGIQHQRIQYKTIPKE